jgi:hypothetical protein
MVLPWRFVLVPADQRHAVVFASARRRDPQAPEQLAQARESVQRRC